MVGYYLCARSRASADYRLLRSFAKKCKHFFVSIATPTYGVVFVKTKTSVGSKPNSQYQNNNPTLCRVIILVLEVGLEPTEPKGGRFTVSCDCHYTIPAFGAASRIRTEDLMLTKQLL